MNARFAAHTRRTLKVVTALSVLLILAGTTYQGIATALERRAFPRHGRMVKSETHQLHIYCVGEGSPTVVLEAPALGMSGAWSPVQALVGMRTRVCSYDRSGLGWSEWGPRTYDPARVPEELRALLINADEHGPFVLVGEGLGAAFARLFASRFPADSVALVLVDAVDDTTVTPQLEIRATTTQVGMVNALPWLARVGLLRGMRAVGVNLANLPDFPPGTMHASLNRPDHLTRATQEIARWHETVGLANAAPLAAQLDLSAISSADGTPAEFITTPAQATRVAHAITTTLDRLALAR